jgi:hypothetical protein
VWARRPHDGLYCCRLARRVVSHDGGNERDASFIAAARTDVPALVARVRELEAEVQNGLQAAAHLAERGQKLVETGGALKSELADVQAALGTSEGSVVDRVTQLKKERDEAMAALARPGPMNICLACGRIDSPDAMLRCAPDCIGARARREVNDPVAAAMLRELAREIERETGPGVIFAAFIDWRDGRPGSYLSNGNRGDVQRAFSEWLGKTGRGDTTLAEERGEVPPLESMCADLGRSIHEEDVDVLLFLFTVGAEGQAAWFSTIPNGRSLVEQFVQRSS